MGPLPLSSSSSSLESLVKFHGSFGEIRRREALQISPKMGRNKKWRRENSADVDRKKTFFWGGEGEGGISDKEWGGVRVAG